MAASDKQVQSFVDQRMRSFAEHVRALVLEAQDLRASSDSVYAACSAQSPTWSDARTDGPPNLLTPADVLAINTFAYDLVEGANRIDKNAQYPVILKACVRPVLG